MPLNVGTELDHSARMFRRVVTLPATASRPCVIPLLSRIAYVSI